MDNSTSQPRGLGSKIGSKEAPVLISDDSEDAEFSDYFESESSLRSSAGKRKTTQVKTRKTRTAPTRRATKAIKKSKTGPAEGYTNGGPVSNKSHNQSSDSWTISQAFNTPLSAGKRRRYMVKTRDNPWEAKTRDVPSGLTGLNHITPQAIANRSSKLPKVLPSIENSDSEYDSNVPMIVETTKQKHNASYSNGQEFEPLGQRITTSDFENTMGKTIQKLKVDHHDIDPAFSRGPRSERYSKASSSRNAEDTSPYKVPEQFTGIPIPKRRKGSLLPETVDDHGAYYEEPAQNERLNKKAGTPRLKVKTAKDRNRDSLRENRVPISQHFPRKNMDPHSKAAKAPARSAQTPNGGRPSGQSPSSILPDNLSRSDNIAVSSRISNPVTNNFAGSQAEQSRGGDLQPIYGNHMGGQNNQLDLVPVQPHTGQSLQNNGLSQYAPGQTGWDSALFDPNLGMIDWNDRLLTSVHLDQVRPSQTHAPRFYVPPFANGQNASMGITALPFGYSVASIPPLYEAPGTVNPVNLHPPGYMQPAYEQSRTAFGPETLINFTDDIRMQQPVQLRNDHAYRFPQGVPQPSVHEWIQPPDMSHGGVDHLPPNSQYSRSLQTSVPDMSSGDLSMQIPYQQPSVHDPNPFCRAALKSQCGEICDKSSTSSDHGFTLPSPSLSAHAPHGKQATGSTTIVGGDTRSVISNSKVDNSSSLADPYRPNNGDRRGERSDKNIEKVGGEAAKRLGEQAEDTMRGAKAYGSRGMREDARRQQAAAQTFRNLKQSKESAVADSSPVDGQDGDASQADYNPREGAASCGEPSSTVNDTGGQRQDNGGNAGRDGGQGGRSGNNGGDDRQPGGSANSDSRTPQGARQLIDLSNLAIHKIKLATEDAPCSFCDDELQDWGVRDSEVWVDEEELKRLCAACVIKDNSFGDIFNEFINESFEPNPLIEQQKIDDSNAPEAYSSIDGRSIGKYQKMMCCQGQTWRQVDITKARICVNCLFQKRSIITHNGMNLHKQWDVLRMPAYGTQMPPLNSQGFDPYADAEGPDIPGTEYRVEDRRCMICPGIATEVCTCSLKLCDSCYVRLISVNRGFLDNLLYDLESDHVRNDAFLLRSDGGGTSND